MKPLEINRVMTFGLSRKMTVVSETIVNNENTDTYSLIVLKGTRGALSTAKRRYDGSLRILF